MMIPIIQTSDVLVIPSNDLVNASNSFVILNPFKLYIPIANKPLTTNIMSNVCEKTYLAKTNGNSMNDSFLLL